MSEAVASSMGIAAYLALFVAIAVGFLWINLVIGRFVRPKKPSPQKLEIYECGEPAIGTSFVQFDLRFYVIALLFIIFDVEVAFFFPWATVFGKSNHLADERSGNTAVVRVEDQLQLTPQAKRLYREMGIRSPSVPTAVPATLKTQVTAVDEGRRAKQIVHRGAKQFALLTTVDILLFFAILLIGFAYVWRRGDLDWVRVANEAPVSIAPPAQPSDMSEPALTA